MNFSLKNIEAYCKAHSSAQSDVLYNLERATNLKALSPQMISGHLQGLLFQMISTMLKPEYILEIGSYTSYSSICLAQGLKPNGKLIALESNEELKYIAEPAILAAGLKDKIQLIFGDARELIPSLSNMFDLVLIDANKIHNDLYYDLVFDKINPGGVILVDNVLWSGKVCMKSHDKDTGIIDNFNKKILKDDRVDNLIIPIRDGLMVIQKKLTQTTLE